MSCSTALAQGLPGEHRTDPDLGPPPSKARPGPYWGYSQDWNPRTRNRGNERRYDSDDDESKAVR